VATAGQVADKFKLNYAGEVLTAISEDWQGSNGVRVVTKLETFHVPDPRSAGPAGIVKLGELSIGGGERLHATRFDGNLVYVVTFFQIDPLWVVDLSDPAKPHVAGSLDVPGWSSYILPLGPRLVAVGIDSGRVAVSLFDVHNPASPGLLSRVLLGQNHSWSEANNDEKAFSVLSDIGLILVPYSGDTTNGWTSQVQLLDLTPTNLVARDLIEHQCQPRRATFSHQRILSLSGWELLSVDAADRDHPVVRGDTELAWSAERVFLQGDYLLQIAAATGWWGRQSQPAVRVSLTANPNQLLGETVLQDLPIVGAARMGNRLYLAQGANSYYPPLPIGPGTTNPPNFVVTILDLEHLPSLTVLGQTTANVDSPPYGGNWQALWPKPDVLVWALSGFSYYPWLIPVSGGPIPVGGGLTGFYPIWNYGGGHLLAFEVGNTSAPQFVSEINLATNGWGFSQAFSSGTLVYLSHNTYEGVSPYPPSPLGSGYQRTYLDVVDYADPALPTVRKPVSIPATLQGVSNSGELLYTLGTHWSADPVLPSQESLDASAYDGVAAHLVASLAMPDDWPHPVLVANTNVFLGSPSWNSAGTDLQPHQVQAWTLSTNGIFTMLSSTRLSSPASVLIERDDLLAAQLYNRSTALFDASNPRALHSIGSVLPPGCVSADLSQADGVLNHGLWLPLGAYGVQLVPAGP
jgi:hypothetical protein